MTQEEKANAYDEALERGKIWQEHLYEVGDKDYADELNYIFPQLSESKDERIRKEITNLIMQSTCNTEKEFYRKRELIDWLEKQGTSYTKRDVDDAYVEGMSFAKDELEKQKPTWSEEDENGLGDALWCCKQAASIAKDENDMGNVWYAEHWLKSIKNRIKGE